MKRYLLVAAALLAAVALPAFAQNQVTLGASVTTGNGTLTTNVTWATSPALTTGTPCTATGSTQWAGAKAGSGTQSITIATSGTLNLALTCRFPGDSIVTFNWTPTSVNTDGSAYTNPKAVRLEYTFGATAPDVNSVCGQGGVVCVDVPDAVGARASVRTVTGITQTGTLRAIARTVNSNDALSDASNAATKAFQGAVDVTQTVVLTVNPLPAAPGALGAT